MQEIDYRDQSGAARRAVWLASAAPAPSRVGLAGDGTSAEAALRRLRSGESLLYQGDWRNARQLLAALGRRLARRAARPAGSRPDLARLWEAERARRLLEHQVLSGLLVPLEPDLGVPLARAPDLREALLGALGAPPGRPGLLPLREVLGMVGAHEWRRTGVFVPALSGRVHPHWGVFAPVRGDHVDLLARALESFPAQGRIAFDVGTGTGVLAVLLARAGARVVATDAEPRAVACALENAERLGVQGRVEVIRADLFPPGRADLVVMNPPWIPGEAHTPLERAVYDPGGRTLQRFLEGLTGHLLPGGEGWLLISDLAEHLGLRPPGALRAAIARAGLGVRASLEARPSHPRARDSGDPLHLARSREKTLLYRLTASGAGDAARSDTDRSTSETGRRGVGRTASP
ncbi:MAG TPA: methyltransferase [Anaeromyxobacteraceae bacterium]|nr:methyltransferase [Anaeromyxobacteraceae bacterium]